MVKITYDHRDKVLGGAFAIQDPAFENALMNYDASNGDTFYGKYTTDEFCEQYLDWIKSTSLSRFIGLEDFKYPVFSAGTTESKMTWTTPMLYLADFLSNRVKHRCPFVVAAF